MNNNGKEQKKRKNKGKNENKKNEDPKKTEELKKKEELKNRKKNELIEKIKAEQRAKEQKKLEEKKEDERLRKLEDERIAKLKAQQEEEKRLKELKRQEKIRMKQERIKDGTWLSKKQLRQNTEKLKQLGITAEEMKQRMDVGERKLPTNRRGKNKMKNKENEEEEKEEEIVKVEEEAEEEEEEEEEKKEDDVKTAWDESSDDDDDDGDDGNEKENDGNRMRDEMDYFQDISSDEDERHHFDGTGDNSNTLYFANIKQRLRKRHEKYEKFRRPDRLRAPIVCVLGHVDTGKTQLLDNLRGTKVQLGEAGGITQQIGATNVPAEAIAERTKNVRSFDESSFQLPGLLIIDTPGHEAFRNLRARGANICDLSILVVDVMHGLQQQTEESIKLLRSQKVPFIIALNKIDRLTEWESNPEGDVKETFDNQSVLCKNDFNERCKLIQLQFAERCGLNVCLFWERSEAVDYLRMIPTSAKTGDGIPNIFGELCNFAQIGMRDKLMWSPETCGTVMEVKTIDGYGTTIDVCLVNGCLHQNDTIVLPSFDGAISTKIKGILKPATMTDSRVKNKWIPYDRIHAAQGVKITAKNIEKVIAGLPMFVAKHDDEIEYYKRELDHSIQEQLRNIRVDEKGVYVQASTLGSLEALLEYLRSEKVPYCGVNIGPVHKLDVKKASIMKEQCEQFAVILAFDVRIDRDAVEEAENCGITIFSADIIYHLTDSFSKYRDDYRVKKQNEFRNSAVFPCKLEILPECIFNKKCPIVIGVKILDGFIKIGTPISVPSKQNIVLGKVAGIQIEGASLDIGKKGQNVCLKIDPIAGDVAYMFGRHFEVTDILMSRITRESINVVKDWFRTELSKADWILMKELKTIFKIPS
ncbi:hypothetical protein SNEBB_003638 [Seison nebaliae]|nr:hypothetical protein SNEBB_003638 [Seison nebaliae]